MAQVTAQCSSRPKLSELQKFVQPHADDKWEKIGTALELFDDDYDGEMLANIEKSSDRFIATMRLWLKTKGSEATWDSLLACLKSTVGLEGAVQSIEENVLKTSSEKQTSFILDPSSCLTPMPMSTHSPSSSLPMSVVPVSTVTSLHSQPPVAIPPPDSIAGQLPYAISGPQPPFPPPEEEPSPSEPSGEADFSLHLEGKTIRNYQWELAKPGIEGKNYIFIAPTGSGKTLVAALVISEHLKSTRSEGTIPQSKVIFMVKTRALADQQHSELAKFIPTAVVKRCMGTGSISISELLPHADIIVCTAGKLLDDIRRNKVKLSEISLMVIDECHNTMWSSSQAKVMENYLMEREKHGERAQLPQVVGLTASPGAGKNKALEVDKTIEHLVTLCTNMDATSGIKLVRANRAELDQVVNKPTFTLEILNQREANEGFIVSVEREMAELEKRLTQRLRCPSPRWTQQYESAVQQQIKLLELSTSEIHRDRIGILKVLLCYSQALNVYMDLRNVDAISLLEEFNELPTNDSLATQTELDLKQRMAALIVELNMLPHVENPLLKTVEDQLRETFGRKRESQGIIFVRTKKHAAAFRDWISSLEIAPVLDLKPRVLTGHKRDTSAGMSPAAQEEAVQSFDRGECNLLVATSVAEEGLNVKACNLVIRFQHVSNEIAKVQIMGRARAKESEALTIISSNSNKSIKEIRNDERIALVEDSLENDWIPTGQYLAKRLAEKRRALLNNIKLKQKLRQQKQQQHAREAVILKCRKCKTFACYGSDIFTSESVAQYVVPHEEFRKTKIATRLHHTPGIINENVTKTHKIHCVKCDADWGVLGSWKAEGYKFPVLKCKYFIFEVNGIPRSVSKWGETPFEIYPLSVWTEIQMPEFLDDSEDSDSD